MATHNEIHHEKCDYVPRKMYPCIQEEKESMDLGGSGNSVCYKIIIKTDFIAKPKSVCLQPDDWTCSPVHIYCLERVYYSTTCLIKRC